MRSAYRLWTHAVLGFDIVGFRDLAKAVRTPALGGAAQLVALDLAMRIPLSGVEGWREVFGLDLGPTLPRDLAVRGDIAGGVDQLLGGEEGDFDPVHEHEHENEPAQARQGR